MRLLALLTLLTLTFAAMPLSAAEPDTRCFEMRTYHAAPGKLDDLHKRFREHTVAIFAKHGITSIGYWTPVDNQDNVLIYVLAYPSRAERDKSWKEFFADPDWQAARKASEANGKLVTKVDSLFLHATDFSPAIQPDAAPPRVFELRTYTATPNNLDRLLARFRDHTLALFKKHGMTSFAYWTLDAGQPGADHTLVYILAHKDADAQKASFAAFRADPDWIAAKDASEKAGGGSLTVVPDGVKSVLLQPTDYSPTK